MKYGLMGIQFPKEVGGSGGNYVCYTIAIEEMSRVCATTGAIISAHGTLGAWPIYAFGTPEQKEKWLRPLITAKEGAKLGAFGLTEPGAGTDAQGQQTTAVLDESGENYILNGKTLRLKATSANLNSMDSPTFIGRRQQHISFTAGTSVELQKGQPQDEAGITVFMENYSHYDLFVRQDAKEQQSIILRYQLGELKHIEKEINIPQGKVQLQVKGNNEFYSFGYSTAGNKFQEIAKMNTRYLSTETAGGFTGIILGLYAVSASSKAQADFDYFDYQGNE